MKHCLVVGGGKWARIIGSKFRQLDFKVNVVTRFPKDETDISREHMLSLEKPLYLIYIASRSEEHLADFQLLDGVKTSVWIEKSFIQISDGVIKKFLASDNIIFNQQLFNTAIDSFAGLVKREISIISAVEQPIKNKTGMLDWLSHDLAIIARIIWVKRSDDFSFEWTKKIFEKNNFLVEFVVNDLKVTLTLVAADIRYRKIECDKSLFFHSNWNSVLKPGTGSIKEAKREMFDLKGHDLLLDSISRALSSHPEDSKRLSEIILRLQNAIFPRVDEFSYENNMSIS